MRLLLSTILALLSGTALAQPVPMRLTNFPNGQTWNMSGVPTTLTVFDNKLFFQCYTPQNGSRIYSYDGSTISMNPNVGGFGDSAILYFDDAFIVAGGRLFFLVMNGNGRGHQLHALLPNGSVIPYTYQGNPLWLDHVPVAVGNYLYWRHYVGQSSLPVLRRMDIATGAITDLSNPQNICPRTEPVASPYGDRLYFSAYRYQPPIEEYGVGFYHIPTGSFTMHVPDTSASEFTTGLSVHSNGKVYFGASAFRNHSQNIYPVANLYSYDGTTAPQKLTNFPPVSPQEYKGVSHDITSAGPYVYMTVTEGVEGPELFRYDPATGTTARVADILPGTGGSEPKSFRVLGNTLYFTAYTDSMYCTEGFFVANATSTVHPLPTGAIPCAKSFRVADYQGKLHYVTVTDTAGYEIHRVDFSPLNVESKSKGSTLTISPNPTSSHLSISLRATGTFTATVLSTTGQILHTESVAGRSSAISVADLPPGLYLLSVSDAATRLPVGSIRFVKQ